MKWVVLALLAIGAALGCGSSNDVRLPAGQSLADPTGGRGPGAGQKHGTMNHQLHGFTVDRGHRKSSAPKTGGKVGTGERASAGQPVANTNPKSTQ
jgi:hypothetical protein